MKQYLTRMAAKTPEPLSYLVVEPMKTKPTFMNNHPLLKHLPLSLPVLAVTLWITANADLAFAQSVSAKTTYWLPTVGSTATAKTYRYGTRLPDAVGAWLAQKGKTATRATDGGERKFIEVSVDWDTNGQANPMGGSISLHVPNGFGQGWMPFSSELKANSSVAAAFDSAIVTSSKTWRAADLFVLVSQGDSNPNVALKIAISEEDQIRALMRALAESTVPGQFYPNAVKIPANLDAMRREIIALGNLGRRDPNYRRKNKYANDLTKDSATSSDRGQERIFRNNQTPPYFNDLVLHPKLNEACQFMAEYYARTNGNAQLPSGKKHDAPGEKWKGAKMDTLGDRLQYFAPGVGSAGEGLAGAGEADTAPTTWMTSETHYRPWFNIGADVKSMGIGAARTNVGWYFCKIGGTDLPGGGVQPVSQREASDQRTAEEPVWIASVLAPGSAMNVKQKYWSENRQFYAIFQPDGNLGVYTKDDGYKWDIVSRGKVGTPLNAKILRLQKDGNLVFLGSNDTYLWGMNKVIRLVPNSILILDNLGELQLLSPDGAVLWSSGK